MLEIETHVTATQDLEEKYYVVINAEEQYSIWPSYKQVPTGWKIIGESKIKSECLAYIEQVWVDMRPLSLRKHMEVTS